MKFWGRWWDLKKKHCLDSIPAKSLCSPPSVMVTTTQITNAKRKEMPQYYSIGRDVIMSLHGWFSFLILSSSFLFLFFGFRNDMNKNVRGKNAVLSNKKSRETPIVFGTLNCFDIACYTMNIWFVLQIEIYTFSACTFAVASFCYYSVCVVCKIIAEYFFRSLPIRFKSARILISRKWENSLYTSDL